MGCFLNELRGGFRLEHGSRTMENKQQASAQFSPYNYSSYPTFLIQENGGEGIFYKIFSLSLSKNCIDHEESRGRGFTFHEMIIFIRLSNFIYRFHFVRCHVDEQVSCNAPWQFSKQTTPSIHIVHNREYLSNAGEIKASLKITRQRSTMEDAFLESCTYILSRTFNHFYIQI